MDPAEFRERAAHYRRTAPLVTDDELSKALIDLADRYDAMAEGPAEAWPPPCSARFGAK